MDAVTLARQIVVVVKHANVDPRRAETAIRIARDILDDEQFDAAYAQSKPSTAAA